VTQSGNEIWDVQESSHQSEAAETEYLGGPKSSALNPQRGTKALERYLIVASNPAKKNNHSLTKSYTS